jgi:ATP synthase F1 gamma subunit
MKMVSAAKLKGEEGRLAAARPFNRWTAAMSSTPKEFDPQVTTFEELPQKVLLVAFSSDKGLCGGINTFITRGVRDCDKKLKKQGKHADIMIIGDKGRGQLRRFAPDKIVRSATDVVSPGTFDWPRLWRVKWWRRVPPITML